LTLFTYCCGDSRQTRRSGRRAAAPPAQELGALGALGAPEGVEGGVTPGVPGVVGDPVYGTLLERQIARNRREAHDHALFAPHRGRLHALIDEALPTGGRVCILGAGNGNDLELAAIAARAAAIDLVDLDAAAVARAIGRLPAEAKRRVTARAPIDLAGGFLQLATRWRVSAPSTAELVAALSAAAASSANEVSATYDLVISDCLLSQLCLAAAEAVGPGRAIAEDVCRALGRAHLRTMTRLTRPGGTALFACDVTSSAIVPQLDAWETGGLGDLPALVRAVMEARLHSVGMNPFLLGRAFREDEELRATVDGRPAMRDPWLWRVSAIDVFLVVAMSWRRRAT
jgi:hypothetical protein